MTITDRLKEAPKGSKDIDSLEDTEKAKLLKILNLATKGGTEAETEAALQAVFKFAVRHDIDLSLMTTEEIERKQGVAVGDALVEREVRLAKGNFRRPPCSSFVISILNSFFRVYILTGTRSRSSSMWIIGRKADVDRAEYLTHFLIRAFNSAWRNYRDRTWADTSSRASFFHGMWLGLHLKLQQEETNAKNKAFAESQSAGDQKDFDSRFSLIVTDHKEKLKEHATKNHRIVYVKGSRGGQTGRDPYAQGAGREAGEKLQLVEGIGTSKKGARLSKTEQLKG